MTVLTKPKEELNEKVALLLKQFRETSSLPRARCHEIARFLRNKLQEEGKDAIVRDGIVTYEKEFWEKENREYEMQLDAMQPGWREACAGLLEKPEFETRSYHHSWCETDGRIIDFHKHIITAAKNGTTREVSDFLLISKIEELDGLVRYNPCGREFRLFGLKFVYIPSVPPLFSRIRI